VKAVLDTNILISAFVFPGGAPEAVYRAALEGRLEIVTSPPLLAELGRVLGDKFGWEGAMAEAAVAQVARIARVVRPRSAVSAVEQDPADDRILEAAAEGAADVIVSRDRHLLQLRRWREIRIVRATTLLDELGVVGG